MDNRGIAIIIVIIISSAILGIGLGISSIVLREIQISAPIDESVGAIMAADAGMERKFFEIRRTDNPDPFSNYDSIELPNGATFTVCGIGQDNEVRCEVDDATGDSVIRSKGSYRNTQRAWEARY